MQVGSVVIIGIDVGVLGLVFLEGMIDYGVLISIDFDVECQVVVCKVLSLVCICFNQVCFIIGILLDVLFKLCDGVYDIVFINGD